MKILLDEMHSPDAATALRDRHVDAIALAAVPELRGAPDPEVLRQATAMDRALVTENVRDFAVIANQWRATGQDHPGLVFTSANRLYRGGPTYPKDLVRALVALADQPPDGPSWVWWL